MNTLAVVLYDRIVYAPLFIAYSSRTPSGISCILYLHTSIYIYTVYALYVNLSSGAYSGVTVATVKVVVAENHRDYRVINTGGAVYLWWKHRD